MKIHFKTIVFLFLLTIAWGSNAQNKKSRELSNRIKSREQSVEIDKDSQISKISKKLNDIQLVTPKDKSAIKGNSINFSWQHKNVNSVLTILNVNPNISLSQNIKANKIALQREVNGKNSYKVTSLEINKNYIWTVTPSKNSKDVNWRTVFLTDMDIDADYLENCEGNLVDNPEFSEKTSIWIANGNTQVRSTSMGCDNLGFAMLSNDPNSVLKQHLLQSTTIGTNYVLNLCFVNGVRYQTKNTTLTVVAYKGNPTSFEPGPDVSIIYKSANIVNSKDWLAFETPVWAATDNFDAIAFLVSTTDREKGVVKLGIDNVCFAETLKNPCDTEYKMELDVEGGYTIKDKGLDKIMATHNPVVTETYQDYNRGPVSDLYGYMTNTDTDMFYDQLDLSSPCFSIGEYDPTRDFEKIDKEIDTLEQTKILKGIVKIAPEILKKSFLPDSFDPIVDVGRPCDNVDGDPNIPFGGADIVYVHGLALPHIIETLSPNQIHKKYKATWPQNKGAFYGGDYKVFANTYWEEHIQSQITNNQGKLTNRYMTVAWPSDQRLGDGIHATLEQISKAIRTGKGVIYNPDDPRKANCFGDRIVFVSHSTGGLLVSSMLGIAELSKTDQNLQKAYGLNIHNITDRSVGHVALSGAFSGSKLASAAVVAPKILGGLVSTTSGLGGLIAQAGAQKFNKVIMNSVLVDLIPPISQKYWAKTYFHEATKPTLTVAGSTPGLPQSRAMGWAGKFLIRGYNDGVLSMDCQCGSDQKWWLRSNYLINNPLKMWDWGNPFMTKTLGLAWDARFSLIPLSPIKTSACIPYLTPAGMLTPFARNISGVGRWDNHYSLIQSTMTHFDPTKEILNYYPDNSPSIFGFIDNNEESRAVADNTIYTQGYVENDFKRIMNEHVRKKTIGFHFPAVKRSRRFPFFKVYLKYYEIVIWKRTYHLMRGHQNKNSSDYVYEYAFRQ